MKALRSSPFLPAACTLQAFILSCWDMGAAAGFADRHDFMKALRSSPFLSPACWLQTVIFDCWLFWAIAGEASTAPRTSAARADWIFMGHSIGGGTVVGSRSTGRVRHPFARRRRYYGKAV